MKKSLPEKMDKPDLVKDVEQWCSIDNSFISTKLGTALLWFIVSFVVTIVILYVVKPQIIKKKGADGTVKDEIDFTKIFIASTIVGMIIGIIGFILKGKCACS